MRVGRRVAKTSARVVLSKGQRRKLQAKAPNCGVTYQGRVISLFGSASGIAAPATRSIPDRGRKFRGAVGSRSLKAWGRVSQAG